MLPSAGTYPSIHFRTGFAVRRESTERRDRSPWCSAAILMQGASSRSAFQWFRDHPDRMRGVRHFDRREILLVELEVLVLTMSFMLRTYA